MVVFAQPLATLAEAEGIWSPATSGRPQVSYPFSAACGLAHLHESSEAICSTAHLLSACGLDFEWVVWLAAGD